MNPLSPKVRLWAAIVAVAAVQTAVLAWMVLDRVRLLENGREVIVDVVPIDPRSLFRGDYVRFNYDFSRVGHELLQQQPQRGRPVYVLIRQDQAGKWQAVAASASPPARTGAADVLLKGKADRWWSPNRQHPLSVRYGIESYFVPEGEGRSLEKMVGEKRISVVLAVGTDGTAAIKGILADGKPIHREKSL